MSKGLIIAVMILLLAVPAKGEAATAPAPPEQAEKYLPGQYSSFGEDLWYVFKTALGELSPQISRSAGMCLSVVAAVLLVSVLRNYSAYAAKAADLAGTLAVGLVLLDPMRSMIQLGADTVRQISEYGKLLLPVMTAAMAAQGGTTASGALYAGTAFFDAFLSSLIVGLLTPMLFGYLCICLAYSAVGDGMLNSIRGGIKWSMTWALKVILYVFTGYLSITGVISGAADAAALKAAKLTISGAVPVVGGILSDASEAVIIGAQTVKSSVGVYGLIAVAAIVVGPFLRIAVQYLLMKVTAGVCSVFTTGRLPELIKDYSTAMGLVLAMTGTICLLLVISLVCFMKGVG